MTTVITMNAQGRLRLPPAIRAALGVEGETLFDLEICDGALVLRPALDIPDDIPTEDRWAYTPANAAAIERALREEGDRQMSETDLVRFIEERVGGAG